MTTKTTEFHSLNRVSCEALNSGLGASQYNNYMRTNYLSNQCKNIYNESVNG